MSRFKPIVAVVLCYAMALPVFAQTPEIKASQNRGFFYGITKNYQPTAVAAISFEDSERIERLIRAGRIYLSLRDAIALALENNLDVETARLNPKLQQANLQRASAGQLLRNVNNSISTGPSSASLGVLAGANSLGVHWREFQRRHGRRAQRPERPIGRLGDPQSGSHGFRQRPVPAPDVASDQHLYHRYQLSGHCRTTARTSASSRAS